MYFGVDCKLLTNIVVYAASGPVFNVTVTEISGSLRRHA